MKHQICSGCKVKLPFSEGPVHAYMDSSPGCWEAYGKVLAREYSDSAYMSSHRLTVDAYAVQHPGRPSSQSIQSVAVHLISLFAILEGGLSHSQATALVKRCADNLKFFWLEPPKNCGELTAVSVLEASTAEHHASLVGNWANEVWHSWSPRWAQVKVWTEEAWAL